jgi:short-subunit dehydrogenase
MKLQLKPLNEQVVVITGATSGIGLTTARLAARRGAKLVLAARSGSDLRQLTDEIRKAGGQATYAVADVASESEVRGIAQEAIRAFGGFDTWVNNAGVSVYGEAMDVATADMRRVFDTNVWGVINGSRAAVEHLRSRGGALVNVGSEVSDVAVPLQAIYSASKHAVKGWTDGLRMELEQDAAPISVTLIKPGPIDTPYTQHARNYLADQPTHVPPVYTPDSVARAILHAATTPVRDLFVGGGAKAFSTMNKFAPKVADRVVGRTIMSGTHSGRRRNGRDALYEPGGGLRERGDYPGMVRNSLYTRASMHPALATAVAVSAGVVVAALVRQRTNGDDDRIEGMLT